MRKPGKKQGEVKPALPEQLQADPEVLKDLTAMLATFGRKAAVLVHVFENVYIFEDELLQKVIVHHDPVYDCGNFYTQGDATEYFL